MQTSNNEMPPASKNSDPESSHLAEREVTENGKRKTNTILAAELVSKFIGYTASELAFYSTLSNLELRRRLSDAKNYGLIKNGDPRKSSTTDRQEQTWYPDHDQKYCDAQAVIRKKSNNMATARSLSADIIEHIGQKLGVDDRAMVEHQRELVDYVASRLALVSCSNRCKKGGKK